MSNLSLFPDGAQAPQDGGLTITPPPQATHSLSTLPYNPAGLAPHAAPQTLRPYQEHTIAAILTAWAAGQRPLATLATGLGKTTVMAELLRRVIDPNTHRALVIAHTKELVEQPFERIRDQFGGVLGGYFGPRFAPGIGQVMAERDAANARIVVATRQSLSAKRLAAVLGHGPIDVVVIDEAHHAAPNTEYYKIWETVKAHNPAARLVGLTATPKRTDRKALGAMFDTIAFEYGIQPAIRDGWLAQAIRLKVKTDVDASGIKSVSGDYQQDKLVAVLDAANWTQLAIDAYLTHLQDRPTLAFFPSVQESRNFVAALRQQGLAAAHIDANTPKDERAQILRDYKRGVLKVVSNMAVLTEGFDAAATSGILMARPTRSEVLYTQIIGRGLRLHPNKANCLILELVLTDTKALNVGTLMGKMHTCANEACGVEFFYGLPACPTCGTPAPQPKPKTKTCPECKQEVPQRANPCPECGYIFMVNPRDPDEGRTETGEGLQVEVASLFNDFAAAWYAGRGKWQDWYSVTLGKDAGALVIAPPTYADTTRLMARVFAGTDMLREMEARGERGTERHEILTDQVAMLWRMVKRADSYTLYYAPQALKSALTNRPLPESMQPPVELLGANEDLANLMMEAERELWKRQADAGETGGKRRGLVGKAADWRAGLPTPGQLNYAKALGAAKDLGGMDGLAAMTKGQLAEIITHYQAAPRVMGWISEDTLPERKG